MGGGEIEVDLSVALCRRLIANAMDFLLIKVAAAGVATKWNLIDDHLFFLPRTAKATDFYTFILLKMHFSHSRGELTTPQYTGHRFVVIAALPDAKHNNQILTQVSTGEILT